MESARRAATLAHGKTATWSSNGSTKTTDLLPRPLGAPAILFLSLSFSARKLPGTSPKGRLLPLLALARAAASTHLGDVDAPVPVGVGLGHHGAHRGVARGVPVPLERRQAQVLPPPTPERGPEKKGESGGG